MNHPTPGPKRLTRSRDDRVIAGVCGGLARYLNMDASLVRILAVVLTLVTSGATLLVYAIAVLVVPEDEQVGTPPHPGPPPAWQPPPAPPAPGRAPQDPVWGREGAPWEQSPTSGSEPPTTAVGDDPTGAGRPDAR